MVSAMKLAFVLAGAVAATSTTPAPSTDCTYAGVSNFGSGLSAQCCSSAKVMVATALLTSTLLPDSTKQVVTSCVASEIGGSCLGAGDWPHTPDTTAYMTAAGIACASSQACGTQVLNGLAAATTFNAMNPTLKLGFDADSDGVLDTCAAMAAASASSTTQPPTTVQTTTTTTTSQAAGGNSAAPAGAVVSGAVAAFAVAMAALV